MSWLEEMKTDALQLAAPGFQLEEHDEIHILVCSSEDTWLSSVTFEPGFFRIAVEVWRPVNLTLQDHGPNGEMVFGWMATGQTYIHVMQECYLDEEAHRFFCALMAAGSARA